MESHKGIYAYVDKKTGEIVYIGKDSYIHKKIRHKRHHLSSSYNEQVINRVLQNNPKRYAFHVLNWNVKDEYTLNALEIQHIRQIKPRFNYTPGGDGFGSGKEHPNFGKTGEDSPIYKDYARVIKSGSPIGKQIYSLEYRSESLTTSLDKERLENLAEEINNGVDPDILLAKPLAVINKEGIKRGEQYFAVVVDEKRIKISRNLDLLQKICKDINDGIEVTVALKKNKEPPKIIKAGNYEGKPYYAIMYDGERIKRSTDKDYLKRVIDDIKEGVEVDMALKKNKKPPEIKPPKIGKEGKTKEGKQRYVLRYRGKKIKKSVDKKYLQSIIDNKEYLELYKEKVRK